MGEQAEALLPLKILKLFALLSLVCVTAWQCYLNVLEYLKHEAVTSVSKVSSDSIDFPQVTICNYNRWKMSLLTPEAKRAAFAAYAKANGEPTADVNPASPIDIYNFTYERGWHLVDSFNKNQFTQTRSVTLWKCYFSGSQCNSRFFRHRMTSYGNCYTFNLNITQDDLDSAGGDASSLPLPLQQTHASETNGLQLYVNVEIYDYSESMITDGSPLVGIKVMVHSKDEQPDPTVTGISVGPGRYATIGVRRTEYDNIKPPEGKCDPDKKLKYFDTYTSSSCETECKMLQIEQNCSCRPYFYPKSNNSCNLDDTLGCAAKISALINKKFSQYCDCPQPCSYEEFIPTVSYAPFPGFFYGSELAPAFNVVSVNEITQNFVGIKVYFSDIGSTVISQAAAHSLTSTLNDLGGTSGLYIGFSCMTFIELAKLIAELVYGRWTERKNSVHAIHPSASSTKKIPL